MVLLVWALLNIGIGVYFLLICFKATKFVRERMGILATVVFVVGILFSSQSNNNKENMEPTSNQIKTWYFSPRDSTGQTKVYSEKIALEKNVASTYYLNIGYKLDKKSNEGIPIWATSNQTGLICGSYWDPMEITVNKIHGTDKLQYTVEGIVDWKLAVFTLYSQPRNFQGTVSTTQTEH